MARFPSAPKTGAAGGRRRAVKAAFGKEGAWLDRPGMITKSEARQGKHRMTGTRNSKVGTVEKGGGVRITNNAPTGQCKYTKNHYRCQGKLGHSGSHRYATSMN